ncbi:MAG: hypothetical protein UY28_C0044G0020 [Candidatus Amesbacteria bacterium GW2011_GWB1_48_13]|uniref:Uncharacterized protein n=1 Tax=Candidatus Amesbacteria bacterium GW2011_GWB1_48_13 TaxID=1618362 RepID=A0A0G1UNF8_9BACT|nr:MAG: hypothetical protein UY28_C0044G0020 [Candidatus Amesbacteria bacterium GW2011_GWB1_48_13]
MGAAVAVGFGELKGVGVTVGEGIIARVITGFFIGVGVRVGVTEGVGVGSGVGVTVGRGVGVSDGDGDANQEPEENSHIVNTLPPVSKNSLQ